MPLMWWMHTPFVSLIDLNPVEDYGYGDHSASVENLLPHKKSVLRGRPLDSKVMAAGMGLSARSLNYAPYSLTVAATGSKSRKMTWCLLG